MATRTMAACPCTSHTLRTPKPFRGIPPTILHAISTPKGRLWLASSPGPTREERAWYPLLAHARYFIGMSINRVFSVYFRVTQTSPNDLRRVGGVSPVASIGQIQRQRRQWRVRSRSSIRPASAWNSKHHAKARAKKSYTLNLPR